MTRKKMPLKFTETCFRFIWLEKISFARFLSQSTLSKASRKPSKNGNQLVESFQDDIFLFEIFWK